MGSWLENELGEMKTTEPPTVAAPLQAPPPAALAKVDIDLQELQTIEDELFRENLQIVRDMSKARDINPGENGVPDEWLRAGMDPEDARKVLRVANASWLSAKEAPVFLKNSNSIVLGIIKARASEKAAPRSLNLTVVNMSAPLPKEFDIVEVEQ